MSVVTVTVDQTTRNGMAIRLAMLMTHYRKPLNWTADRYAEAGRTWVRWAQKIEPTAEDPPEAFIAALADDLNTPQAIALMHSYYRTKNFKALYASMRFLGLLPEIGPECQDRTGARHGV